MSSFIRHTGAALLVLLLCFFVATLLSPALETNNNVLEFATVSVQHSTPAMLQIERSSSEKLRKLLKIRNTGTSDVRIDVPTQWRRTEVSDIYLSTLRMRKKSTTQALRLPAGATLQFVMDNVPKRLDLTHISSSPLSLSLLTVHIETSTVDRQVFLLQSGTNTLWHTE